MEKYAIQLLTVGAMATLNEYADEQAAQMVKLAHFVPQTFDEIRSRIIESIKYHWRTGRALMFEESLPEELLACAYSTEMMETDEFVYDITSRVEVPILTIDSFHAPVTDHTRVYNWLPVTDPCALYTFMPEATTDGFDKLNYDGPLASEDDEEGDNDEAS
jgi:hypothetical protein